MNPMNDLSIAESTDLSRLESIIDRTKKAASEFYDALKEIRDRKLFRADYHSFALYCEHKWGKSSRAINLEIEAEKIRKQIPRTTGSPITRNTALALKNVKPKLRQKVFQKAQELAGSKPVSPTHIAKSTTRREITIRNLSDIYATTPQPQTPPRAATPALPTPLSNPTNAVRPPPITDIDSAILNIDSIYELHKAWFNDISTGRPRTPRQVIDKLISELRNAA